MSRLTRKEQRKIVKLYQSGKNFNEIKKETGRSREAQIKVLGDCGLYLPAVDNRTWDLAQTRFHGTYAQWKSLSYSQRLEYFKQARPEVEDRCKSYLEVIMMGDESDEPETKESSESKSTTLTEESLTNWSDSQLIAYYDILGTISHNAQVVKSLDSGQKSFLIEKITSLIETMNKN